MFIVKKKKKKKRVAPEHCVNLITISAGFSFMKKRISMMKYDILSLFFKSQ